MKLELIATATFGLEAVVKREIQNLDFKILSSEDGKITYQTNERGLVKSNLWLRSADRVLLKLGEFKAITFEELFQQMKGIPWENWIPLDGNFKVDCTSVRSQLASVPSCQSIAEKAIVTRLQTVYNVDRFEKSGSGYVVKLSLLKDRVTVTMDTSGTGLHKRGYRGANVEAPIKETLAAAMVQLSYWKEGRLLVDPLCGSGTIAIEAAMIGRNMAPGINRKFAAEEWDVIPKELWKEERKAAFSAVDYSKDIKILAADIDKKAIEAARENAIEAGVDDCIDFKIMDFKNYKATEESGIIITNPPYGERLGSRDEIERLYKYIKAFFKENLTWTLYLITSDKEFESACMGISAHRRRKLYNGRIETCYYQYYGTKKFDKR